MYAFHSEQYIGYKCPVYGEKKLKFHKIRKKFSQKNNHIGNRMGIG